MKLKALKSLIKKIPFPPGPDYGKSEYDPIADPSSARYFLVFSLIIFFVFIAFLGDLWPVKNVGDQAYVWTHFENISGLSMGFKLSPAMRYSFGSAARYFQSLFYIALVKLFYLAIPHRLLCLRVISIVFTSVSLFFIYRIGSILFCRAVGILLLFILVTSPVYVESFRAFGYIPVTNAIVCIICYLLVLSLNNRKVILKTLLLALFSYITLSLYVIGRLIILLPLIVFGLYFKRYWRQLLIFIIVLVGLVLVLDSMIGDTHFDLKGSLMINSEWIKASSPQTPIDGEVLWGRLCFNLNWALRRLAILSSPFYDIEEAIWVEPVAIINALYAPFLIIGLLVNFIRRRISNVVLLGWLFLVFFIPLFADWVALRRFALALTPIYFLVAIGMWWTYRFFYGLVNSGAYRKTLASLSLVFVLLIGGYNIVVYFRETARPDYDYSQSHLKRLATYIAEKGRNARVIRFNRSAGDLLWGNPYFDRPIIGSGITAKMEFDEFIEYPSGKKRPGKLLDQIEYSKREGGNALYIHLLEQQEVYYTGPIRSPKGTDNNWSYPDIEWVNENMRGEVELEQLPGVDEVYFLYVK